MRDPAAILGDADIRRAGFDPAAPACVVLACVLHFVDAETAHGIVAAPGSRSRRCSTARSGRT
jgi:hypothetical protein